MSELNFIVMDEEPPENISLETLKELNNRVNTNLKIHMTPHTPVSGKSLYSEFIKKTIKQG